MNIVLIATEWGNAEGGINSFNRAFAIGLAKVAPPEARIFCAVPRPSRQALEDAKLAGVTLVAVTDPRAGSQCGKEVVASLSGDHSAEIVWVGHDVITGHAAAAAAVEHGGRLALLHHMAYRDYKNARGGDGERTNQLHREQVALFSTPGAVLFGVGPLLKDNAERLGRAEAHLLIPGFPDRFEGSDRSPKRVDRLDVIVAGRFDHETEPLKQCRLAVAALGKAISSKDAPNALKNAGMVVIGLAEERVGNGELEVLAEKYAGRRVRVTPSKFDDSGSLIDEMAVANLAIVPSFHEGFGLVGWEAIGSEVPLIIGMNTGLYTLVSNTLEGEGAGRLKGIELWGGDLEPTQLKSMSEAIIEIAGDLPRALRNAAELREMLSLEHGCSWADTAEDFLSAIGPMTPARSKVEDASSRAIAATGATRRNTDEFRSEPTDHYPHCVELSISTGGQGCWANEFNIVATLRFGITEMQVDGIDVGVYFKRAVLEVSSDRGRLVGDRLGEPEGAIAGLLSAAGARWIVTDPAGGDRLTGKMLGDEALCRIRMQPAAIGNAKIRVSAAFRDVDFDIDQGQSSDSVNKQRVMGVFLKKRLFSRSSGHYLLSEAQMHDGGADG